MEQRWHNDGKDEWRCSAFWANWGKDSEVKDMVSREMHANSIRAVESCFTPDEWEAASKEMHDSGNQSWCGVVRIAVRNLRDREQS
jgi:hypothetical protein